MRAVYRRRRLMVAVIGLLVVAAIVWLLVAQPWRALFPASDQGASASSSAAATPTAAPSADEASMDPNADASVGPDAVEDEAVATVAACTSDDVTVEALTDKDGYARGELPQLSIRLTNTGGADCTINVGTSGQSFVISSGSDTWWRSTDCQAEPSEMVVTLAAGQVVESATPLAWDRTRSSVSTCDGERSAAPGGGASYHLEVSIGGIPSLSTKQFLLY